VQNAVELVSSPPPFPTTAKLKDQLSGKTGPSLRCTVAGEEGGRRTAESRKHPLSAAACIYLGLK